MKRKRTKKTCCLFWENFLFNWKGNQKNKYGPFQNGNLWANSEINTYCYEMKDKSITWYIDALLYNIVFTRLVYNSLFHTEFENHKWHETNY